MKTKVYLFFLVIIAVASATLEAQEAYFRTESGNVSFVSDAPLEIIRAESEKLHGILDPLRKTFAFSIPVNSFIGFNNDLQQQHFNENYLESHKFPEATFTGKIIEDIDLEEEGTHEVRAKGLFFIHGVQKERIIKCTLEVKGNRVFANTSFSLLLDEFDITIPRVVNQKIAEEIAISVSAEFQKD